MKTYFDSSALVAAMVETEAHYAEALAALADVADGFTSTHAIAETFATLTGGRMETQLTPNEAMQFIDTNVVKRLSILELSLDDYEQAIVRSQAVGARGGAIFDMLHLEAARRGNARRIFTINLRHFQVFAPDLKEIISLPRTS